MQGLIKFHPLVLKIHVLRKQNVTDGPTDGRMDGQRENSIPAHKHSLRGGITNTVCGVINRSRSLKGHHLKEKTIMGCNIPSFLEIGLLVPEKKLLKGFYHIWAWQPSWSCDQTHVIRFSFSCT